MLLWHCDLCVWNCDVREEGHIRNEEKQSHRNAAIERNRMCAHEMLQFDMQFIHFNHF